MQVGGANDETTLSAAVDLWASTRINPAAPFKTAVPTLENDVDVYSKMKTPLASLASSIKNASEQG
jgi:hypothetical protein